MMIQQIPINKIQFDPTQPRKFVDQEKVKGMAQSILTQGVINPIEVDEDFKIVTGELRYRASQEAGLKKVPCKVIKISKKDRFERQVVENVHHNTMSPWDTAKSLNKLLTSYQLRSQGKDSGISQLARKLGKSEGWIRNTMAVLEASKEMQEALQNGTITQRQFLRARSNEDKPLQKKLEKFILENPTVGSETIHKAKKAIRENPEKEAAILEAAKKDAPVAEVQREISDIAKTTSEKASDFNSYLEEVEHHASRLLKLLSNPPENIKAEGGVLEFNSKLAITKLGQLFSKMTQLFNHQQNELESNSK